MNTQFNFEIAPFEWASGAGREGETMTFEAELENPEMGEEFERGGRPFPRRSIRPPRKSAAPPHLKHIARPARHRGTKVFPPRKPSRRKPPFSHFHPRNPIRVLVRNPYSLPIEPFPRNSIVPSTGTESIRWAQDCLNQTMGLRLAVNGVMGADARSALRRFQVQQGLRGSGILGPDTEEALKSACRGDGTAAQSEDEFYLSEEAEIPAGVEPAATTAIQQTIPTVPLPNPTYISLGHLNRVSAYVNSAHRRLGAGLYLIAFTDNDGRRRAYSGETADLGKRLLDHRRCAVMLGVSPSNYQVYVLRLPLPAVTDRQRRDVERLIHTRMRDRPGRVLTNRNLELEEEMLGSEWN